MNYSIILYILGWILNFEAGFLTLPGIVAIIYKEKSGFAILATLLACLFLGLLLTRKKPKSTVFYTKEGFITVALGWIILSIFGAMPFLLSGEIPSVTDALFETISGFTTTGASILNEVESLSHCILFWRSFTHWIGGMGVLVFILAILPLSGGYNMNLMRAESPGPSVSKLVPRVRSTAMILYGIYIVLTLTEIGFLLAGRMPLFDALTTAFGTAGTGGFGIKNDSMGGYSGYIQTVVTVFMILFGVNFSVYFLVLIRKPKQILQCEELRLYMLVIFAAIAVISVNVRGHFDSMGEAIHHSAFQVASIITTTGFATVDFNVWPQVSRTILIMLMFIGACAGSTGGGIKVSRILILLKTIKKELYTFLHPHSVKKIKMDGRTVEHEVVRSVNVFLVAYVIIFAFSVLLVGFDNFDLTTNFTSVAATLNNIGPGLELVGPARNFSIFSPFAKYVLMFDMLAGRLELFPMLLLFLPASWKKF